MSVEVINLVKTYGEQKAVNDISFQAKEGEVIGFLGPNGAGKSTTMKIATGFIPPTSGTVKVCGFDVTVDPLKVQQNLGYLPEHNPLYLDMYVKDYLKFIGNLHQLKGKSLKERVAEMVQLTGLTKEQHKKIGALSKGYRQRVGLAQALIHDPKVLILDEPTTGLDPNQIVEVRNVIKTISKDKTVVFSTHIMQEVQAICDRAIIINNGEIVANDDVSKLKTSSKEVKVIRVEFKNTIDTEKMKSIEGVEEVKVLSDNQYEVISNPNKDVRGVIFNLSSAEGWELLGLNIEEKSLENVFQELTKK